MASVAQVWLAGDLARLGDDPSPCVQAGLYRCARETGWSLKKPSLSPADGLMQPFTFESPQNGTTVGMRVHRTVPVLGFVDADALHASFDGGASSGVAWDQLYLHAQPLVACWQLAGSLVPDAAWLNANPTPEELNALGPGFAEGARWRHWRQLSRGDALFFDW